MHIPESLSSRMQLIQRRSGDTFTGYYLAGRIQQMPVEKALDMAAKASAIAVSRKGAAPSIPSRDEVTQYQQL